MPPSLRPEHVLAAILSSAEDALVIFAPDGTVQQWSKGAERLYGYTEAEITGRPLTHLIPQHETGNFEMLLALIKEGNLPNAPIQDRVHKKGSTLRVRLTHSGVRDEQGEIVAVVESGQSLSANPPISCEASLRSLLEQMPAVVWTTDRNLRITSNWGSGMQLSNVKPGELIGRTVYDVLKCQDAHAVAVSQHAVTLRGTSSRFEYRQGNRDFEIRLEPLRDTSGEIIGCVGAGVDITERKRSEEQARYQATHDALTGLSNYRDFLDALEREVRRADRASDSFAVLLLDLDDLKRINDRWGHLTGNRALRRLAEVLKEHCRSTDLAARYGGDEFAVLLIDADPSMARQIAQRVERALDKEREEPRLHVSIGIGVYPDDGRSARDLLDAADQQLYKRKKMAHGEAVSAR